jgi:hypothetical protein
MKIQFNMVINGKDQIEKKFEDTIKENPDIHMDLIKSFAHAVMMAFRFNKDDEISVNSFRGSKVIEPEVQVTHGVVDEKPIEK